MNRIIVDMVMFEFQLENLLEFLKEYRTQLNVIFDGVFLALLRLLVVTSATYGLINTIKLR